MCPSSPPPGPLNKLNCGQAHTADNRMYATENQRRWHSRLSSLQTRKGSVVQVRSREPTSKTLNVQPYPCQGVNRAHSHMGWPNNLTVDPVIIRVPKLALRLTPRPHTCLANAEDHRVLNGGRLCIRCSREGSVGKGRHRK